MKSIVSLTIHDGKSFMSLSSATKLSRRSVNSANLVWIAGSCLTKFVFENAGATPFRAHSHLFNKLMTVRLLIERNGAMVSVAAERKTYPSPCVCFERILGVSIVK